MKSSCHNMNIEICSNLLKPANLVKSKSSTLITKMSDSTNTPHPQTPPLYNFYFADQLNVSQNRKDSRSSSIKSQKLKQSLNISRVDAVLQETKNEPRNVQQSLLEGIEQNQFIPGYSQKQKNANFPTLNPDSQFLNQSQQQQDHVSGPTQEQFIDEHETSFLLDSDTYKEICIEEHSKKVQYCSNFDVKSLTCIQDLCSIHDKPFEIVCVEDKTLVCSHCAIFGQHKTHSLAPLNQIQKSIFAKKSHVSQIISDYKALQLNIKQKYFSSQFVQKITLRKNEIKLTVEQQFRKIRQFLSHYEHAIQSQLDQFYHALESSLTQSIKRTSLDSNTAAFQRWQKDAWMIIQQITCEQVPKKSRINLFLNNFTLPQFADNLDKTQEAFNPVSLQIEGEKYFCEIKEELNLNINQIMKTVDLFNISLNDSFEQKLKSLITFQCDTKISDIIEKHNLTILEERIINVNSFDSIKESMKHIQKETSSSTFPKHYQNQLASTVVSFSQSTSLNPMLKSSKYNSPMKKQDSQKQQNYKPQPRVDTIKKSLKYRRLETLQDMKKLQQNIRTAKSPQNVIDSKSECGQNERKISPCLKDIVGTENQKLFMSSLKPRMERLTSKEFPKHKRSPSDEFQKERPYLKSKPHSLQKNEQPLKALQNYEKSQTQTLDLSSCNLNDTEILYFIQKASKMRKIKHLKLSSNSLTSQGFQKLLPYLSNCNLMNLSNNKLSEMVVELILRRKQKLGQLKMLNLANNKVNEKKIKEKMGEFKKMNIVVTL